MSHEQNGGGFRGMLRAFRHRNFRLYFSGQSISLIGTWVQQIALSWTIYQLTHSSFLLGAVSFAGQLPLFILTPLAGEAVDRVNGQHMLIITQSLAFVQALALAVVVATGTIAGLELDRPERLCRIGSGGRSDCPTGVHR